MAALAGAWDVGLVRGNGRARQNRYTLALAKGRSFWNVVLSIGALLLIE